MTRDQLAAEAMKKFMDHLEVVQHISKQTGIEPAKIIAMSSYEIADAMIEVRDATNNYKE